MTNDVVSEADYLAAIPKHCFYQTVEEHVECLMLCWGLLASVKSGYAMNCGDCEINTSEKKNDPTP